LTPAEADRVAFAARVRAGRAVLGWSQTALAKKAAITQRAVHRIEKGAVRPRQATVLQIDRAFNEGGLKFKMGGNGGFSMVVPFSVLKDLRFAR
jgi:DNA-binding XRE family transcriptional regulator